MNKKKTDKIIDKPDAVIYNFYYKEDQNDLFKREVNIAGLSKSVCLSSEDPEENIDILTEKALFILNKLKEGE